MGVAFGFGAFLDCMHQGDNDTACEVGKALAAHADRTENTLRASCSNTTHRRCHLVPKRPFASWHSCASLGCVSQTVEAACVLVAVCVRVYLEQHTFLQQGATSLAFLLIVFVIVIAIVVAIIISTSIIIIVLVRHCCRSSLSVCAVQHNNTQAAVAPNSTIVNWIEINN